MKRILFISHVKSLAFSFMFLIILMSTANSQPSLMADDIVDLVVPHNGQNVTFTLLRDAFKRSQWYYVPKEPRLTEVMISGVANPELTLMRYQFVNPSSSTGASEGGILQFAITLSPEGEVINALKARLKEELDGRSDVSTTNLSLSALPIKKANASIYAPSGKDSSELISNAFGGGTTPIFASQKAPFALYLTKWGADLNDALIGNSTTSNTGVPVVVTFTFQGLTPPAHLHIEADYKQLFNHYSSDKALAAKASYFGLFGASSQVRWSSISEQLKQGGALIVTKIGNADIDEKNMDQVMQAVMKRINDNVFQLLTPPSSIPPASASMPNVTDRFGGVGYNASYKRFESNKEYKESFDWTERKIVDRETLAGGFIGIGKYPPSVRERAVKFVPRFQWDLAQLILPDMSDLQRVQQVSINTELLKDQNRIAVQSAIWRPTVGWQSVPGNRTVTTLDFSIASAISNGARPEDLKFRTTTTVTQAGRLTTVQSLSDAVTGGIPVSPPVEGFTTITFDPSDLIFKNLVDTGKLLNVVVTMRVKDLTFNANSPIQPILKDGKFQPPVPLSWVIKEEETKLNPIKVNIRYNYTNGMSPRDVVIDNLLEYNNQGTYVFLRDPTRANP